MCLAISCSEHFCQPALRPLPGVPPSSTIVVGSFLEFSHDHFDEVRAERAEVLGDSGHEILAGLAADIGAVVKDDENAGLGGLLDGRQQRRPGIGEDHDDVDLLRDKGAHVGDRLGGVAAGRGVDDLLDARIGQRLLDEFHLGDLAPDILAEAVGIGDGEIAVPGLADVVLPAFERKLALFRRQIHRRVLDGLDDHRRDILGGADGLQHQFVGVAGLRRGAREREHRPAASKRQRPAAHSPKFVFHCRPPLVLFDARSISVPTTPVDYLFFSHGYRAVSFPA